MMLKFNVGQLEVIASSAASAYFTDQELIDGTITVVELTPQSCRWPTGNPRDLKTFRYCGENASCGPYCERHARLAYLPRAA
jgi:GcrA cell cycle regulator